MFIFKATRNELTDRWHLLLRDLSLLRFRYSRSESVAREERVSGSNENSPFVERSNLLFAGSFQQSSMMSIGESEGFLRVRVEILLAFDVFRWCRADLMFNRVQRFHVEQFVLLRSDTFGFFTEDTSIFRKDSIVLGFLLKDETRVEAVPVQLRGRLHLFSSSVGVARAFAPPFRSFPETS